MSDVSSDTRGKPESCVKVSAEDEVLRENASCSVPRQLIQINSTKALLTGLHLSVWPGLSAEQQCSNHQTSPGKAFTKRLKKLEN